MKKLYKKGKVHPTPPLISDHLLAFLPATILTLTAALSPEDREVLAYLISCSATPRPKKNTTQQKGSSLTGIEHPPLFNCNCFFCYTSYWVRWDASPNRQLIHDIIDAFEDELAGQTKKMKNKKERRKKGGHGLLESSSDLKRFDEESVGSSRADSVEFEEEELAGGVGVGEGGCSDREMEEKEEEEEEGEEDLEKGSVRKFVSFIGERIWGVWG